MVVEWFGTGVLDGPLSTETRIAATVVLGIGLLAVYVLTPVVLNRGLAGIKGLMRTYAGSAIVTSIQTIDWPFPTGAVTWLIRVSATLFIALSILPIWGYQQLADQLIAAGFDTLPFVLRGLFSILVLFLAWALTRILRQRLFAYTAKVDHVTEHQESVVYRVLQVSVLIAAGFVALSAWNVDLQGLLIGAGFLGIVVGMAARQTLGSLIAGFVLMFSRPFEIGDWIQMGDNEGIVTDITIVNTRLRSFDDETVVIPNDVIANRTVRNLTESERLRLRLDVGISYDTDLDRARTVLEEALADVDQILSIPKPTVVIKSFGDSAIVIETRFWIEPATASIRWKAQTAVIRSIKTRFDEEGIEIPFPQRDLSGELDGVRIDPADGIVRPDPDDD